jgi:hypothetical protein
MSLFRYSKTMRNLTHGKPSKKVGVNEKKKIPLKEKRSYITL